MSRYIIECPNGVKVDVDKNKGKYIMGVLVGDIVRCKECAKRTERATKIEGKGYCGLQLGWTNDDDFCSWAERKEQ